MSLKAIFNRAPLLPMQQVRLSFGKVRSNMDGLKKLYNICCLHSEEKTIWEGGFGLSCLLEDDPIEKTFGQLILNMIQQQKEDGGLDLPFTDQIAVMRSALCVFEVNTQRKLLEKIVKWCAYAEVNWDSIICNPQVRQHPADLMEFFVRLYRITGTKAILRLCSRLRTQAMDWSNILVTFDQKQGLKKQVAYEELIKEIDKENGNESGYYTRKYLTAVAENFADGIRYSIASSLYSGNGQEMTAGRKGWNTAKKYHNTVCGGTTADRVMQGQGTHRAVDSASLGAWCEAFCNMLLIERTPAILEDLADLIYNGMSSAAFTDNVKCFQRVNSFSNPVSDERCYEIIDPISHNIQVIARLSRGFVYAYHTAITETENGPCINLMLPGVYSISTKQTCKLEIIDNRVELHTDTDNGVNVQFAASADFDLHLNEDSAIRVSSCTRVSPVNTMKNGDILYIDCANGPEIRDGHHQSKYIKKGNIIYSLAADKDHFAWAFCGSLTEKGSKVFATFKKVKEWKQTNGIPANVAVCPETEGELIEMELKPYAFLDNKMTVFPRGV